MIIFVFSLAASALILTSTLPALLNALRAADGDMPVGRGEILGRALQAGGNVCWMVVGFLAANWPLMGTAAINVVLLSALIVKLISRR